MYSPTPRTEEARRQRRPHTVSLTIVALLAAIAAAFFVRISGAEQEVFYWVRPHGEVPPKHASPLKNSNWTRLDQDTLNKDITLKNGHAIWFALENVHHPDFEKTLKIAMQVKPWPVRDKIVAQLKNDRTRVGGYTNDNWQGKPVDVKTVVKKGSALGVFNLEATFTPQPDWEYFGWHNNTGSDYSGFRVLQIYAPPTECVETAKDIREDSFNGWWAHFQDMAFGIEGWMMNDMRITEIEIYPERAQIDTTEPPLFDADPPTGPWSYEYTSVDPDGIAHPQGGVRWTSAGDGLAAEQHFNMSLAVIGQPDTTYRLFIFDADTEQNMDYFVKFSGFPWYETFAWSAPGEGMHGQWDWQCWEDDPAFDAEVTDVVAHSDTLSMEIKEQGDLINTFEGADSGLWSFSAWQYIPTGYSGQTYFMLLNAYAAGGYKNWSSQVRFDSSTGLVESQFDGGTAPIVYDEWVELRVDIDLDTDVQTLSYGGTELYTKSWTEGVSGGGTLNIGALDLYANGATSVYYDDLLLERLDEPEEPCPGDVNGDGVVDIEDLFLVLNAWGACYDCVEDVNGDGVVDIQDVFVVLANWGPCA